MALPNHEEELVTGDEEVERADKTTPGQDLGQHDLACRDLNAHDPDKPGVRGAEDDVEGAVVNIRLKKREDIDMWIGVCGRDVKG